MLLFESINVIVSESVSVSVSVSVRVLSAVQSRELPGSKLNVKSSKTKGLLITLKKLATTLVALNSM